MISEENFQDMKFSLKLLIIVWTSDTSHKSINLHDSVVSSMEPLLVACLFNPHLLPLS